MAKSTDARILAQILINRLDSEKGKHWQANRYLTTEGSYHEDHRQSRFGHNEKTNCLNPSNIPVDQLCLRATAIFTPPKSRREECRSGRPAHKKMNTGERMSNHEYFIDLPKISRNVLVLHPCPAIYKEEIGLSAALLPEQWPKRLVDENTEALSEEDLAWADLALIGAMALQRKAVAKIISRCNSIKLKTVAGGPLFTAETVETSSKECCHLGRGRQFLQ